MTIAPERTRSATPDPTANPSLRLWLHLMKAARLIEARANRRLRQNHGQSLARFDVLAQLLRLGDEWVPTGQLSARLLAVGGNATGVLDRMEIDGLIERRASPVDRRSYEVRVTQAGRALLAAMNEDHTAWIAEMLAAMPLDRQTALAELIIEARHAFNAADTNTKSDA
jgi:DNA-binding MarR family transcriptional regulator